MSYEEIKKNINSFKKEELKDYVEYGFLENVELLKKAANILTEKGYEVVSFSGDTSITFRNLFGAEAPKSWHCTYVEGIYISLDVNLPIGLCDDEELRYELPLQLVRQKYINDSIEELMFWAEQLPNIEKRKFFGFALADSMFAEAGDCTITRRSITVDEVREMAGDFIPCLNPSHKPTIEAAKQRYGLEVEIPETPPRVSLKRGDSVVVMGVRGLPRLTDRHEYTEEEIAQATFDFSVYTVE